METDTIRLARPGEEGAIHAAHMRSIREVCAKDYDADVIRGWSSRPVGNRWTGAIDADRVWVVDRGGAILGLACLWTVEEEADILALYLVPEATGRGHGRRLVEIMLETARDADAAEIAVASTLTARDFYRHMGFAETGPVTSSDIGGVAVPYVPMAMRL